MIDDWWLMIDDWWLMIDDQWLMINDNDYLTSPSSPQSRHTLSVKMICTGPDTLSTLFLITSLISSSSVRITIINDDNWLCLTCQNIHHLPHLGVRQDQVSLSLREGSVTHKPVSYHRDLGRVCEVLKIFSWRTSIFPGWMTLKRTKLFVKPALQPELLSHRTWG